MSVLEAARSFAQTRWVSRRGQSRATFERAQHRMLDRWLAQDVPRVGAFAGQPRALQDLPVMEKADLMADFTAYNCAGITADQVRDAMTRDFRIGHLSVGASTGTSGNRGLFVISERERFRWLGSILAKTMADMVWRAQRVAIILPQGGALYDSANRMRLIDLRFFDLTRGADTWTHQLERFDPTVIVAPPKVLRHLAQQHARLRPARLFAAAETLDPLDRPIIEGTFDLPLRQIYMATEGLLGVSCAHGTLHLAEDAVRFEYTPVGDGLVNPIISSFRRQTQILARYRMNDLLRLAPLGCACGSPLQPVSEVVGRVDDCFRFGTCLITPDVLRNAVVTADTQIDDFRVIQKGPDEVHLILCSNLPDTAAQAAHGAVRTVLQTRGVTCAVTLMRANLCIQTSAKLRRVECRLPPSVQP